MTKHSVMECERHGDSLHAFICKHFHYGNGLGFIESICTTDPEWAFKNA
ncbi:MAG: hypothetical protein GWM89_07955 [Candidatus Dadabacteria bacterium]|nr:hypothetical protein [Candidatus Dadabacteria bacterium]NIV41043.1 hypothetical protein [Candidatus Dadabacteria bacterium]NIX15603.1 hypothetical protein [Candidatus Dadabacteria bacterium]NIY22344.1 hypothetical protein [Candidatus Dadabacteria bacterium]